MPFDIYVSPKTVISSPQKLKKAIETFLDVLGLQKTWVHLAFVEKKTIKDLNLKYRKKNKITDVLSFPFENLPPKNIPWILGEIVICSSFAKEQARKCKLSHGEQLIHLVAHGLVHLSGLDHERSVKEATKFKVLEKKLLCSIK